MANLLPEMEEEDDEPAAAVVVVILALVASATIIVRGSPLCPPAVPRRSYDNLACWTNLTLLVGGWCEFSLDLRTSRTSL